MEDREPPIQLEHIWKDQRPAAPEPTCVGWEVMVTPGTRQIHLAASEHLRKLCHPHKPKRRGTSLARRKHCWGDRPVSMSSTVNRSGRMTGLNHSSTNTCPTDSGRYFAKRGKDLDARPGLRVQGNLCTNASLVGNTSLEARPAKETQHQHQKSKIKLKSNYQVAK